jgi:23S rRNA (pseudouridine1915-N3)-methyltransferase
MPITLIVVGQKMPAWVDAAFADYARRLPAHLALSLKEVKAAVRRPGEPAARAMASEGERILALLPAGAYLVALDERGQALPSKAVAARLTGWMRVGVQPTFVIGGADGLAPTVKTRADECWSVSAMTLPHGLVRVLLAEQLYRAWTILEGHPYHRE